MGSPDPHGRQLNGMGGGLSSLSKVVVVDVSKSPDVDLEYTFVQVAIKDRSVDLAGNCGNLSSAVGPYALESGIIELQNYHPTQSISDLTQSTITLSLLNTNTNKRINASFPVHLNAANAKASFSLDGVSGTGAPINLDYLEPGGARTGKLFPTGNKTDIISVTNPAPSVATTPIDIPITLLDCTNPTVYVRFSDLRLDPNSVPKPDSLDESTLQLLEAIRRRGAELMGLDPSVQSQPKIALVGPPLDYKLLSGARQDSTNIDLFIQALSMGQPHKAVPTTVAMATAVAARIPGTVVSQITTSRDGGQEVRIGHPSGTVAVGADIAPDGHVMAAKVFRTARILMRGEVYW
ncbi:hypothetical protein FRB96_004741 [Tulasnella sp. 330]|nr:hypothetical protein FRB96_004741 [Tulasnella sp. 330]KAG8876779.1 hypothetical protein FRB97_003930 [Tulasnella sp. 331]KAG8882041.1 hypothetical protein FRB98_003959 [Tulasnella sp. 332]